MLTDAELAQLQMLAEATLSLGPGSSCGRESAIVRLIADLKAARERESALLKLSARLRKSLDALWVHAMQNGLLESWQAQYAHAMLSETYQDFAGDADGSH